MRIKRLHKRRKPGTGKDLSPGARLEYAALLARRAREIRRAPRAR